ncbi:MAG: DUF4880 domain-containing protein [Variovorax sp.]|nr:MAG: DUF4880 domain-containing protein [Variovorax sp.]
MNPIPRLSKSKKTAGDDPTDEADRRAADAAAIEAEALRWVVLLNAGEGAPQRHADFVQWRDSHPAHAEAMRNAYEWWRQVGHALPSVPVPAELPLAHTYAYQPPTSTFMGPPTVDEIEALVQTRSGRPTLVAAIVLAMTALLWWSVDRSDQTTGMGESRTVRLSDGSMVQLDTDTAVDIDMTATERRVELGRGEVFVDVVQDAARPFLIDAGIGLVRVHGTALTVRREHGAVSVTVERGEVQVDGPALQPAVRLHAGQRLRFDRDAHSGVQPVSIEHALAWRAGQLKFQDERLVDVLAEIRRYDPRLWFVPTGAVAEARMTTTVAFEQVDPWLDALPDTLPVKVLRFGPVVWVREVDTPAPR